MEFLIPKFKNLYFRINIVYRNFEISLLVLKLLIIGTRKMCTYIHQ